MRKTLSIITSPPGTLQPTRLVSKSTSPALPPPPPISTAVSSLLPPPAPPLPPILPPLHNMPTSSTIPPYPPYSWNRYSDDYQDLSRAVFPQEESRNLSQDEPTMPLMMTSAPFRTLPSSKTCVSVGCQTEDNPLFPPIQAGNENMPTVSWVWDRSFGCVEVCFCIAESMHLWVLVVFWPFLESHLRFCDLYYKNNFNLLADDVSCHLL